MVTPDTPTEQGWALCPTCYGDGTTDPDPDTQTRPWCRTCLGLGVTS